MKIIVCDLETTGLPEQGPVRITEFAYATWDTESGRVTRATSTLINDLDDVVKEVPAEITKLTGIDTAMVSKWGVEPKSLLLDFWMKASFVDAVLARNGIGFDFPIINETCRRHGVDIRSVVLMDDYVDVKYPDHVKGSSLSHICGDLGFLNPWPHSALGDVMSLVECLKRSGVDMTAAVNNANSPIVELVGGQAFKDNDLAKKAGFKWNAEAKQWRLKTRQSLVQKLKFDFPVTMINAKEPVAKTQSRPPVQPQLL